MNAKDGSLFQFKKCNEKEDIKLEFGIEIGLQEKVIENLYLFVEK